MKKNRVWLLLLGSVALLSLLSLLLLERFRQAGDRVEIYQNGALLYDLPLHKDRSLSIQAEKGGYNEVLIEGGQVLVSEADCPDQVCVRHGPTGETADPIVCLPHRLVVQVSLSKGSPLEKVSQ